MIGAVEARVDVRSRGLQGARQAGAAHHHVGGGESLPQREDALVLPGRMPELDRDADAGRDRRQECRHSLVVTGEVGRQLREVHSGTLGEHLPDAPDALEPPVDAAVEFHRSNSRAYRSSHRAGGTPRS